MCEILVLGMIACGAVAEAAWTLVRVAIAKERVMEMHPTLKGFFGEGP